MNLNKSNIFDNKEFNNYSLSEEQIMDMLAICVLNTMKNSDIFLF